MEKLPTAVEWFAKEIISAIQQGDKHFVYWKLQTSLLEQALEMEKQQRMDKVEFAKLHVEAALKAVSEKKTSGFLQTSIFSEYQVEEILNAYPLENIK